MGVIRTTINPFNDQLSAEDVTQGAMSGIENDRKKATWFISLQIARVFGTNREALLGTITGLIA